MTNNYDPSAFLGARLIDQPGELEQGFRFSLNVVVRFNDLDSFGHVNNAIFLTYCEMARVAYYGTVSKRSLIREQRYILAHADVDYRTPIFFGEQVRVLVRATKIGTKSFNLEYRILAGGPDKERLAAESSSVQVAYDYTAEKSVPVPEHEIAAMEDFEGRKLRG